MKRRAAHSRLPMSHPRAPSGDSHARGPAFLFDLDGTLVDSAYEHALAWRNALRAVGIDAPTWKVHRQIGMSGGLIAHAILSEGGGELTPETTERVKKIHSEEYERMVEQVRPLPGAKELLAHLTRLAVPWIIATSSRASNARRTLAKLGHTSMDLVITREDVEQAKPDPDLFQEAARRLDVPIANALVVGDSIWDILAARRAGALGVGLLTGGISREELEKAGALRVYEDPADLLRHLHEVGVRPTDSDIRKAAPPRTGS